VDRIDRRAASASLIFHGALALIALVPALALRSLLPSTPPPPIPPAQRLVLAPDSAPPPPPPLPALAASSLPGWAELGVAPIPAEAVAPRNTDGAAKERSRGDQGEDSAPVRLPRAAPDALAHAARLDGKAWSEPELTAEQKRVHDAASFLEVLLQNQYRTAWRGLRTPTAKPTLYLQVRVDDHSRVVDGRRLTSTGSTGLDEAIDRWLHDQGSPISLPTVAPGEHVFGPVTLW
jgi:hypothetical protein